jgi:hypothetical protein
MRPDQAEWNISYTLESISMIDEGMKIVKSDRNIDTIFCNYNSYVTKNIDVGLIRWRRREDPRPDFLNGLSRAKEAISAFDEWNASPINKDAIDWNLARTIGWLMERTLPPVDYVSELAADAADVALDQLLVEALYDRPYRDQIAAPMAKLDRKARQKLSVVTHQCYFDLLDAAGDAPRMDALVAQAEANYTKRARDSFYGGGPTYMGGGPDNPYVVDWQLAAILKKIGWQGESIHKWRWD